MRARAALRRRRAARRSGQRLVPAGRAAARPRRGDADRPLPAHDLHRLPRAGDALSAGAARARRLRARAAAPGGDAGRGVAAIWLAAGRAGDRLRRRAGAGPVRWAPLVLFLRRAHRLGLPHARGRLPDPPRPGLLPSGPAQLARPVPERLLQHLLPLRSGHPLRRERFARARPPDLGLPAVQRVHARALHRPGLGTRAPARPRRLPRRAGDVDDHAAGARLRLRADRLRQGDLLAAPDPRARRARRAPPALAARPSPRGHPVRARCSPPGSRRSVSRSARGRSRRWSCSSRSPPGTWPRETARPIGRAHATCCCSRGSACSSRSSPRSAPGSSCRDRCRSPATSHRQTTRATFRTRSAPSRSSAPGWSRATSTSPPVAISPPPTRWPCSRSRPPCSAPRTSSTGASTRWPPGSR